jgi:predicted MFS family arabinose efflux permease
LRTTEVSWREWGRATGSLAVLTGVSTVLMGTLPLLNGLFANRLHLDWHQLGWLGGAAQTGSLAGTLLGFRLSGRGAFRLGIQAGAVCALLAWSCAAFAPSFGTLVLFRTITAIGVGCVFSIGTYLLANSEPRARSFSVMSGVQVVCGSLHSALLPWLHSQFGYAATVASLALWFVLILLLGRHVNAPSPVASEAAPLRSVSAGRFAGAGLLVSVMAFQMAATTFWSYSERIASSAGLEPTEIAFAISIGNLGGVPASILGAVSGERFGFVPILIVATAAAIGGELMMTGASTSEPYVAGQFVFNFGWILGVSYYLALLARRSHDPKTVRAAPIALVVAGILGPLAVATLAALGTTYGLFVLAATLALVALVPAVLRHR